MAVEAVDSAYMGSPINRDADIGIGLGLSALFLASAIYGVVATNQCIKVKSSFANDVAPVGIPSTASSAPPGSTAPRQLPPLETPPPLPTSTKLPPPNSAEPLDQENASGAAN
jgi:hypothetical protein